VPAPPSRKERSVILSAGAPEGRTLRAIEHAKLDHALIGNYSREAAQGIYFAHELAFGDASHGGIAGHLANLCHVHGDEEDATAHVGSGRRRFIAGMSSSHDNHIILGVFHG
jgi:hypothetical protein